MVDRARAECPDEGGEEGSSSTVFDEEDGTVDTVGHDGVVQGSATIVGLGVHLSPSIEEHLRQQHLTPRAHLLHARMTQTQF